VSTGHDAGAGRARRGSTAGQGAGRPVSYYGGGGGGGGGGSMNGGGGNGAGQVAERARSKSVMDGRTQFTREGRAILHFGELLCVFLPYPLTRFGGGFAEDVVGFLGGFC